MLWAKGNAFGHWLGYICPSCEQKIPCLWNVFSLLLLVILFPIWFPLKMLFEQKYIAYELSRIKAVSEQVITPPTKMIWIKMGASFGLFMFLFFAVSKYFQGGLNSELLLFLAGINALGGIFFGAVMWFFLGRKKS